MFKVFKVIDANIDRDHITKKVSHLTYLPEEIGGPIESQTRLEDEMMPERIFLGIIDDASMRNAHRIDYYTRGYSRLIFEIMPNDDYFNFCELENYIVTQDGEYVIKQINYMMDGWYQITCEPNLEDWYNTIVETFDAFRLTGKQYLDLVFSYVPSWSYQLMDDVEVDGGNITFQRNLDRAYDLLDYFFDGTIPWFDTKNKIVKIYRYARPRTNEPERLGKAWPEVIYSSQTGLKDILYSAHSYNLITEMLPIGANGLRLSDLSNNPKDDWVYDYAFSPKSIRSTLFKPNITHIEKLTKFAETETFYLTGPSETYRINLLLLGDVSIGDQVRIYDEVHHRTADLQIKQLHYFYQQKELSYVILGDNDYVDMEDFTYDLYTEIADNKKQINLLKKELNELKEEYGH